MIVRTWIAAAVAATPFLMIPLAVVPVDAAHAQASIDLRIGSPPPPPRIVAVPPPRAGYIWVPGYWEWRGRRHVWVDGRWLRERRGYRYVAPGWEHDRESYRFRRGHWKHG